MLVWRKRVLAAGIGLLSAGCAAGPEAEKAVQPFCMAGVSGFSNAEAGARGDFSPNVAFMDLRLTARSVGYGAAGGRSDEITIADGVLHLARPDGAGGFRERTAAEPSEGAYMVQLVSPASWRAPVTLEDVDNIDELGAVVARAAQAAGCTGDTKLAYRIEARIETAEWSLDTLPQRGDFTAAGQDAVIVGLYANVDQGAHFVPVGRNIHAHVVFPALGVAGHLKAVRLAPGARLTLQGG
jgi:hypothetical protein